MFPENEDPHLSEATVLSSAPLGTRPLGTLFSEESADLDEVLPVLIEILRMLDALHRAGIQHDFLSPASIRIDQSGLPSIRTHAETVSRSETIAAADPKYAVPESFWECPEQLGCAVGDSYVLGFLFYELLLGRRRFRAQFPGFEKNNAVAWLGWHADRSRKLTPLSELVANFPRSLSKLIEEMTEKDPSHRAADLTGILDALESAGDTTVAPRARVAAEAPRIVDSPDADATVVVRKPPVRLDPVLKWIAAFACGVLVVVGGLFLFHRSAGLPANPKPKSIQPIPVKLQADGADAFTVGPLLANLHLATSVDRAKITFDGEAVEVTNGPLNRAQLAAGTHSLRIASAGADIFSLAFKTESRSIPIVTSRAELDGFSVLITSAFENSAKLYATPDWKISLVDGSSRAVPSEGLSIAVRSKPQYTELVSEDGETRRFRFTASRTPVVNVFLRKMPAKIPLIVSSNAPNPTVVINGRKSELRMVGGKGSLSLFPGSYHIKLIERDYYESPLRDVKLEASAKAPVHVQFDMKPVNTGSR